jgi:hypothetical protein
MLPMALDATHPCKNQNNGITKHFLSTIFKENNEAVRLIQCNRWRDAMDVLRQTIHFAQTWSTTKTTTKPTAAAAATTTTTTTSTSTPDDRRQKTCSESSSMISYSVEAMFTGIKVKAIILDKINSKIIDTNTSGDNAWFNCAFCIYFDENISLHYPNPSNLDEANQLSFAMIGVTSILFYNLATLFHFLSMTLCDTRKMQQALELYQSCLTLLHIGEQGLGSQSYFSWISHSPWMVVIAALSNLGYIYSARFDWIGLASNRLLLRAVLDTISLSRPQPTRLMNENFDCSKDDTDENDALFILYFQIEQLLDCPAIPGRQTHAPSA